MSDLYDVLFGNDELSSEKEIIVINASPKAGRSEESETAYKEAIERFHGVTVTPKSVATEEAADDSAPVTRREFKETISDLFSWLVDAMTRRPEPVPALVPVATPSLTAGERVAATARSTDNAYEVYRASMDKAHADQMTSLESAYAKSSAESAEIRRQAALRDPLPLPGERPRNNAHKGGHQQNHANNKNNEP